LARLIDREAMDVEKQHEENGFCRAASQGETPSYESLFNPVIEPYGQFVVSIYEEKIYPRKIISFNVENFYISATVKDLKS
jgi:hypothetical protein